MKFSHVFALLIVTSTSAVVLDDLVSGDPSSVPYTLAYLVKRVQFESEVQRPEKLLSITIEEHKANQQDERLISACTLQNPFVAIHILESNVLALDNYSLIVLTLHHSQFGFNDYRTFQRTLTKTTNGLLDACKYCEEVKMSGNLTEKAQEKLKTAELQVKNVLQQAETGADLQKKLFWPESVRKAVEGFIKDKAGSQKPPEVVSSVYKFIGEKYGDSENYGILGERFGIFAHSKNDKILKKSAPSDVISIPFAESTILNVYRVSQTKIEWTKNYEAFEEYLPDIRNALVNASSECLPRTETLQSVYKKAFDAASAVYEFPALYLVPNMIEDDPNWSVDNGMFQLDGDSIEEKVTINMCADQSTLSVYFHIFVGF